MQTQILPVDGQSLELAKKIITNGGAVAFPTETVYGLGANAFNTSAVENVFKIKGRPNDNPLIVHVHKDYDLSKLVYDVPEYAQKLANAYLPGPLTMVYKSLGAVSSAVSCGLETLAVRIPSHTGAQNLLRYLDLPVAAPSANISKHVSPTTARHVYEDLKCKIELVLDGGSCAGGIESTVLDCTGDKPVILRSGLITQEMITAVAGECGVYVPKDGERVRSPGMKYKHYAPACRTELFAYCFKEEALEELKRQTAAGVNAFIMCDSATARLLNVDKVLDLGETENDIAANLYAKLREGEQVAELIIAVAPEKQDGVMSGVMNRLKKACGSKL